MSSGNGASPIARDFNGIQKLNMLTNDMQQFNKNLFGLTFEEEQHGEKLSILEMNKTYKMLFFDETSHNPILMNYWKEKHTPIFKNENAYYLFNFIYPCSPINPEKCLVIL